MLLASRSTGDLDHNRRLALWPRRVFDTLSCRGRRASAALNIFVGKQPLFDMFAIGLFLWCPPSVRRHFARAHVHCRRPKTYCREHRKSRRYKVYSFVSLWFCELGPGCDTMRKAGVTNNGSQSPETNSSVAFSLRVAISLDDHGSTAHLQSHARPGQCSSGKRTLTSGFFVFCSDNRAQGTASRPRRGAFYAAIGASDGSACLGKAGEDGQSNARYPHRSREQRDSGSGRGRILRP